MFPESSTKKFLVFSIVFIILVLGIGFYFDNRQSRDPYLFLIPKGFTGLVTIEYEQVGSPPLDHEGLYVRVPISQRGTLKTSSPICQTGTAPDKYFFVSGDGNRILMDQAKLIHFDLGNLQQDSLYTIRLFVGTEDQFHHYKDTAANKK